MHFQIEAGIGTSVEALDAHLFELTVDGLNGVAIVPQFEVVHKPLVGIMAQ